MVWVAASVITLVGLVGVLAVIVGLPGMWLALLTAILCKIFVPEVMPWTWIGVAGALAVFGEIVEFGASAAGAKAGGSGKAGAWGALLGGLVGAILGTIFIPIPVLGTILGGAAGAGLLAVTFERKYGKKTWKASTKAGAGAAAGKLVSTLLKAIVAGVMVVVLSVAAFWPNGQGGASPEQPPSGMLGPEAEPSTDDSATTQDTIQDRDVTTDDRPPAGDDQLEPDPDG
ncbi:MAG: DUF456 domain-containing protein [Planctomycetota bacterium]